MARKMVKVEKLIDDIDGTEAECTLTFAVEGNEYEIDLSPRNKAAFEKAITAFVQHARVRTRPQAAKRTAPSSDQMAPFRHHAARIENLTAQRGKPAYDPHDIFRQADFPEVPSLDPGDEMDTGPADEPALAVEAPEDVLADIEDFDDIEEIPPAPVRTSDSSPRRDPEAPLARRWASNLYGKCTVPARGRTPKDISAAYHSIGTPDFAENDLRLRERLALEATDLFAGADALPDVTADDIAFAADRNNRKTGNDAVISFIKESLLNDGFLPPSAQPGSMTNRLLARGFAERAAKGRVRINGRAIALLFVQRKPS